MRSNQATRGRLRQLNGMDATFVFVEGRSTPMHLTAMYIYDQSTLDGEVLRHKDLLRLVASRLDSSPVFRQRLVRVPFNFDRPYWVTDDAVDLEYHVRHLALPKPQDWRQLCVLAARLHARPLDLSKPPWEIDIVEGLDDVEGIPPGSFALLVKYHHAAVDGATGNDILGGLTDTEPGRVPLPELPPYRRPAKRHGPGATELLTRATVNSAGLPLRLLRQSRSVVPGLRHVVRRVTGSAPAKRTRTPTTRFNARVSPHRVVQGAEFALQDFRAIKNAVSGATVNDVVLALCGGTLREYLLAKDELPEASLVAAVPISTRVPGEPAAAGNALTAMTTPLQSHIADPLERLRAVHEATKDAKELTEAVGARQLTELSSQIPAVTMALACRLVTASGLGARTPALATCVVTNVPGPQVPLYLDGARLVATYGFGPLIDGMGLLILATSYNGKLFVSFTACRDIVEDPQFLVECLRNSFDSLTAAAAAAGPAADR